MSYRIELENKARKEFLNLAKTESSRIGEAIDHLQDEPRPAGVKKLSGLDGYRLRKGNYRILYTIDDKKKLIRIYKIGHRRDVYKH